MQKRNVKYPYLQILLLLFFIPLFTDAQMLEIAAGTNINALYIPHREMTQLNGLEYKDVPGWSAAVKISEFSSWGNPVVAILVDRYNSHLLYSSFTKTTIGIGFYPVNIKLYKGLHLQAGPEISFMYTAKGQRTTYIPSLSGGTGYGVIKVINAYGDSWNKRTLLGASAALSYSFNFEKGLYITPEYKYYNSILIPEISDTFDDYYSRRHSFMVAIGKKL